MIIIWQLNSHAGIIKLAAKSGVYVNKTYRVIEVIAVHEAPRTESLF